MNTVIILNSVVAFALEIAMLIAYGTWAYRLSGTTWLQWLLALGSVTVVAVLWGLFAAPRAQWRLDSPWLYLFGAVLMLASFALLWHMGCKTQAVALSAITIAVQTIAYATHQ